jgi:hypothetical protein
MDYGYQLLPLQEMGPISGKVAHGCWTPQLHLQIHSGYLGTGFLVTRKETSGYLATGSDFRKGRFNRYLRYM